MSGTVDRRDPAPEQDNRYRTAVRVRWSDLDAFGHVNNARTVTLLEEARVDWLFIAAAGHGVQRLTQGVVVAHLSIDYLRPIGFGAQVVVGMGITKLGRSAFTVDYQVTVDGQPAATATTVLVPVDPTTFKPRRLDDVERQFLERYRVTPS